MLTCVFLGAVNDGGPSGSSFGLLQSSPARPPSAWHQRQCEKSAFLFGPTHISVSGQLVWLTQTLFGRAKTVLVVSYMQ